MSWGLALGQGVIKVGPEFRVNTHTGNYQSYPRISGDGNGPFIVVWHSKGQDGSQTGVYSQRYNASGVKLGVEFRVNTYTTSYQSYPDIAEDSSGNFVVAWQSYGQVGQYAYSDIYSKRYASNGTVSGTEFRVNSYTSYGQGNPRVDRNLNGFVVVWGSEEQDGAGGIGVYGQRYNSLGAAQGSEFRVNSYTTSFQSYPDVGLDGTGNFNAVWSSFGQDGSLAGVYGQRFNSVGTKQGSEFRVNAYTSQSQENPAIAVRSTGTFIVVWDTPQDGSGTGVEAQLFSAAGVKVGAEFKVNTYSSDDQRTPSIAMDASGNFVVVWTSYGQDGSGYGVFGQRYTNTGVARGVEFPVNTYTTGDQVTPAVTMDASGGFTVAWASAGQDGAFTGIYAQRFSANDCAAFNVTPPSSVQVCSGEQASFSVTASGTGPITYQWRRNSAPLTDGGTFTGTTTPNLTVDPVSAAVTGSYSCVVKDACAPQGVDIAGPVTLTLLDPGVTPALMLTKINGGADLQMHWGATANATDYSVFEDASPSGPFTTLTGTSSSGAAGLTVPLTVTTTYYLVAASNDCGLGPKN